MRTTLLSALGVIAIAVATTQFAAASERQHVRKQVRPSTATMEQFRNSNAAWTAPYVQPDVRYSGGWSAPAGH
jgi:hypothetical protein